MIRFLLTLLAFVSGLSAIGPAAEARVCGLGGAEVGAVEAVSAADRVAARQQGASTPRARRDGIAPATGCRKAAHQTILIPTVQFGPDRAFE